MPLYQSPFTIKNTHPKENKQKKTQLPIMFPPFFPKFPQTFPPWGVPLSPAAGASLAARGLDPGVADDLRGLGHGRGEAEYVTRERRGRAG